MKPTLLYGNLSRNEIAEKLLAIAEKKFLVRGTVLKFRNNPFFSTIFNHSDVESELNITVFKTLHILERYNATKILISERDELMKSLSKPQVKKIEKIVSLFNAQKVDMADEEFSKISCMKSIKKTLSRTPSLENLAEMWNASVGELNLDTEAFLTGYLITAFNNNISKIYGSHQTHKRKGEMIYLDAHHDETEDSAHFKNKLESFTAVEPIKEREYGQMIVSMAKHLRSYDKRQNQISQNQKSQLTKLFCAIVNPKKVEDNEELRTRFNWSQYLLNKNKELLITKIREEFSDYQEDIIDYLDSRENKNRAS